MHTLDPRLLVTFVHAAHSGSLSSTAVQLGRTQSAVTMQMKRLEETLGQTLLHRSGTGVRLTGSGERFLALAERILSLHDEATGMFSRDMVRGSIIFGSPEDYLVGFFPSLLRSFGIKYPDVEVKVVAAPTVELKRLLQARKIDIALISTPNPRDVESVVRTEQLVWVGNKPSLEQLNFGDTLPLALPASNNMDYKAAREAMDREKLRYHISYASNSLAGLIAVARSGLAISVMTQCAVPPDLCILNAPLPKLPHIGILIAGPDGELSTAGLAFQEHARTMLSLL
jgi:DNA-binding transcriptional LysR family regulator